MPDVSDIQAAGKPADVLGRQAGGAVEHQGGVRAGNEARALHPGLAQEQLGWQRLVDDQEADRVTV
ncbi:hypothetical protein AB0184_27355, partial [Klebsiella pneumoniae]